MSSGARDGSGATVPLVRWGGVASEGAPGVPRAFLRPDSVVDFEAPRVLMQAAALRHAGGDPVRTAEACFVWVRDQIRHSADYQLNPLTCSASEVLEAGTGYCFAKSHLLAALLRANGIPAGFSYQRLSVGDGGPPYCTHGLNAVYLPDWGWYRVDARGNKTGIDARFSPPDECLAYRPRNPEEYDFPLIYASPLPAVVKALRRWSTWNKFYAYLPDIQGRKGS